MIKNTTPLNEAGLTFTPYKSEAEAEAVPHLIEEGMYTSIIALQNGWVCETDTLETHENAIAEFMEYQWPEVQA